MSDDDVSCRGLDVHALSFRRIVRGEGQAADASREADWPAPGLDDTDLSESGPPLELHRA
jgi:hypothetical protein